MRGWGAIAVVFAVVAGLGSPASAQTVADVQTRDNLIAAQEALLNVYRCRFGIDTEVVPGGCTDGAPNQPADEPGPFAGMPTGAAIAIRDKLVVEQEALLNVYRCRFGIDTEVVPGGCTDGAPVPQARIQATIQVPEQPPSGRCTHAIAEGPYHWEECAWDGLWENPEFNYSLSDQEAQELIEQIWGEVDVQGKPERPPTSSLVPAGSTCATATQGGIIIGCYQPDLHHIRRLDAFLKTLLHETAHALVAGALSVEACRAETDAHAYNVCTHNDVFRCVADHLYTRYAEIEEAGVCGTVTPAASAPDNRHSWDSDTTRDAFLAWVPAFTHTMSFPFDNSDAWLIVRCRYGDLDVFLSTQYGFLAGQFARNNRIPVLHAFLPRDYWSWDDQRRGDFLDDNGTWRDWWESADSQGAFLPDEDQVDFINEAVQPENPWIMLSVRNFDNSTFGTFLFETDNALHHIRPVTQQCGWTWS